MKRALILMALGTMSGAQATFLNLTMVADNLFTAYVSTNDSLQGTQFLVQTGSWQDGVVTGSVVLTPNVTNYLHVRATNQGGPAMILGQASLTDGQFFFPDNSSILLTNTASWQVSTSGFGSGYITPTDYGPNNSSPIWGTIAGLPSTSHFIWSDDLGVDNYFSVAINAVPEPATVAVLASALITLTMRRKKRPSD